ncbi:hypothetical protein [Enterovirga rhinocerotis]|uniref:Uncharacterized protein n=1 Tax=Enterovirga rhinocerotis TaxID=1339210 RepID=A0A4R7CAK8_9HYPH|nr:hypothetical protein [Enterovirga rhinocerotis]TDR94046.1 hypothetical protein EV668_1317 [Enterovirga rhinocerotis]
MAAKPKSPSGWGELNIALNGLVKAGTILGYKTARPDADGSVGIEVTTARGADQAEVLRQVRDVLPEAFATAGVRTREG